jgi:DNA topoisomerase IB
MQGMLWLDNIAEINNGKRVHVPPDEKNLWACWYKTKYYASAGGYDGSLFPILYFLRKQLGSYGV